MSRGNNGPKHEIIVSINYLLFYKLFYRFIIDYKKDLNYLYNDMKITYNFLFGIKNHEVKEYLPLLNSFLYEIAKNEKASFKFKIFLYKILDKLNDNNT